MTMFVFQDQARFMKLCGQTTEEYNPEQLRMYYDQIKEEMRKELDEAFDVVKKKSSVENVAEVADALLDSIVVCVGALYSMGIDPQSLWNEVVRTNLAKVDPKTGKVRKREDGKVLKPEGWKPPNLVRLVREQMEGLT
jgi:predicted HAD superfamily Cof-like phosphohydrolase